MGRDFKPVLVAVVFLLLVGGIAALVQFLLLPKLPTEYLTDYLPEYLPERWRRGLLSLGTSVFVVLVVIRFMNDALGSFADHTGITWKDLVSSNPEPTPSRLDGVEDLIDSIQSALHDHDRRLPYALALCLDLCERFDLPDDYGIWLRKELNGYNDYAGFQDSFDSIDAFDYWMERWAAHRRVKPYVKFVGYAEDSRRVITEKLKTNPLFVAFPIAEIIRRIETARNSPTQEIAYPLRRVDPKEIEKIEKIFASTLPGTEIPHDLQVFLHVSDLERILDGVRAIALSLLIVARSQGW